MNILENRETINDFLNNNGFEKVENTVLSSANQCVTQIHSHFLRDKQVAFSPRYSSDLEISEKNEKSYFLDGEKKPLFFLHVANEINENYSTLNKLQEVFCGHDFGDMVDDISPTVKAYQKMNKAVIVLRNPLMDDDMFGVYEVLKKSSN